MGLIRPKSKIVGKNNPYDLYYPFKSSSYETVEEITYTKHLQMPKLVFCVLGPNWAKLGLVCKKIQNQ